MRPGRQMWLVVVAAVVSALAPVLSVAPGAGAVPDLAFPGWPATLDGRTLTALALTEREAGFVRDFPGRVARFSDGEREIVMRYVVSSTRRLHPASDCYRGLGYQIEPRPMRLNARGEAMGCFRALKGGEGFEVCETIRDDHGQVWPDVSSWYWDAVFSRSQGPWWNAVVAMPLSGP